MSDFGRLCWCSCAALIVISVLAAGREDTPLAGLLTIGFIALSAVAALGRLYSMKRLTPAEKYLFAGIGFLCIAALIAGGMANRAQHESSRLQSVRHYRPNYRPNYGWR